MSTVCSSKLGGGQLKRKRSWPFWAETGGHGAHTGGLDEVTASHRSTTHRLLLLFRRSRPRPCALRRSAPTLGPHNGKQILCAFARRGQTAPSASGAGCVCYPTAP